MPMTEAVCVRAYSSIANLGHGLDVLGVAVDAAFDDVTARRGSDGLRIQVSGAGASGIPADPMTNTAGLAVEALRARAGFDSGIDLEVRKGIRPGSGLGSSAASAAAAVVAVNELLALQLDDDDLVACAAAGERASAGYPHADNAAAAVCGGFVVVLPGDNPRAVPIVPGGPFEFVVATPEVVVTTSEARARLPRAVALAQHVRGCAHCALIAAAIRDGDAAALGVAIEGSWVDTCRAALIPGFEAVCVAAREAGATGVAVSGGGPSVMAVVSGNSDGARIACAMKRAFAGAGVRAEAKVARVAGRAAVMEGARR